MAGDGLIDSEVTCMMLDITPTALRQLVYRKILEPKGRRKRRSLFLLQDVLALQTRRTKPIQGKE